MSGALQERQIATSAPRHGHVREAQPAAEQGEGRGCLPAARIPTNAEAQRITVTSAAPMPAGFPSRRHSPMSLCSRMLS
jgi:hypothetical protein